ncbi:hypothetical protein AYI68_g6019 [Smittium mucronatum]|uniref:Uncharacterized protein n=1 Tax=Smittium mucronatum TaxID=133383 RepID=A0A1R0GSP6_9FUNG|nr:hypothetical protein AYI68_g6019 [Smittium mucronatum]
MIGENLIGELGPELNESSSKEDARSSIIGSPSKSTDGSKYQLNSRTSIEIDAETSISVYYTTSSQAPTSGANP